MSKNNQLVLITGGLGFVGIHLAKELIECGFSIILFDNLSPQVHGQIPTFYDSITSSHRVKVVRGNIANHNLLKPLVCEVDAIVHLAAETGTAQSMYSIAHYNQVNSQGTAILLDLLANEPHKVKKFILSSSRSIYGEGEYNCSECGIVNPKPRTLEAFQTKKWEPICPHCRGVIEAIPTTETCKANPASIYAATKLAQEDLVRIACNSFGVDYIILRLQNVYGEGQSLNNPYTGIFSIFSKRIRLGLTVSVFEDGLESRDFVHVSDVTKAIRISLDKHEVYNKTINIGSGKPTSVFDLSNLLVEALNGKSPPVITEQYRFGDIRHCYANIDLAKRCLGFQPEISLIRGIERFSKWFACQPLFEDKLDEANAELLKRRIMG